MPLAPAPVAALGRFLDVGADGVGKDEGNQIGGHGFLLSLDGILAYACHRVSVHFGTPARYPAIVMTQQTFLVDGMTCEHCVKAVTEELGKLDGVEHVAVDLASGRVTVEARAALADEAVAAAVDEAGYEVHR